MSKSGTARPALSVVGFCGADDSVDPRLLAAISQRYPWVEWGVLFRDDKEGQPRFASAKWVEELIAVNKTSPMQLAGHLCSKAVRDLLSGDDSFVRELKAKGFNRVQLNATAANNFDPSSLSSATASSLHATATAFPEMEFIVQRNEETKGLWEELERMVPLANISYLFDESKGLGSVAPMYPPPPPPGVRFGYTGGLGPKNLSHQLAKMGEAAGERLLWCDMESSMRSTYADGTDFFDVNKAIGCIRLVIEAGIKSESCTIAAASAGVGNKRTCPFSSASRDSSDSQQQPTSAAAAGAGACPFLKSMQNMAEE